MQAIVETLFDSVYLISVIIVGILMIKTCAYVWTVLIGCFAMKQERKL